MSAQPTISTEKTTPSKNPNDQRRSSLQKRHGTSEELESLRARRKEAASAIAPNFLAYYERIRTKRWPAVVQLNQECVCEGCHLVQPPSVQQMVQRGGTLVACTMCGRVLYRDSEF